MEYIIFCSILVGIVGLVFGFSLLKKAKLKKRIIAKISQAGKLEPQPRKKGEYIFTFKEKNYYLKLLYVGYVKEVSINSKRHWQIRGGKKPNLLKTNGFEDIKGEKILFIYPTPQKLVKYINENEVVFIKAEEKCFDFYLLGENDLVNLNNVFD